MVFRPLSILQDSVVWVRLWLLTSDCKHVSCVSISFNSGTVREHKIIVKNEIQELRTKINNHLNQLQENMMKELTEAQKQITNETQELLVSLDERQSIVRSH
jgi:hypothetical protein